MVGYKNVMTWSSEERKLRLCRFLFGGLHRGIGGNWLARCFVSISFVPRIFRWQRDKGWSWELAVLGIRLHYKRSYGGWLS